MRRWGDGHRQPGRRDLKLRRGGSRLLALSAHGVRNGTTRKTIHQNHLAAQRTLPFLSLLSPVTRLNFFRSAVVLAAWSAPGKGASTAVTQFRPL